MLKNALSNLSRSERQRLTIAAVIIVLLAGYLLVWQPAVKQHTALQHTLAQKQLLLSWMQNAAQEVKRAGQTQTLAVRGSLQQYISQQAQRHKLKIARLQTTKSGGVLLQLDKVRFNALTDFLNQLAQQGLSLEQVAINRGDSQGIVSTRITFGALQ